VPPRAALGRVWQATTPTSIADPGAVQPSYGPAATPRDAEGAMTAAAMATASPQRPSLMLRISPHDRISLRLLASTVEFRDKR
jgi:hypothetical protein